MQAFYRWFKQQSRKPFPFQEEVWQAVAAGKSGLLNAPTGSGKTLALALPLLGFGLNQPASGIQAIWITPIRALAKDLMAAMQEASAGIGSNYTVGMRTGDATPAERKLFLKNPPQLLITTPETLHVLFSQKNASRLLRNVKAVVVDEWHELLGSKRGVQTELALARLRALNQRLMVWGISATIGNLSEAMQVLLGKNHSSGVLVKANINKKIKVVSILPDEVDKLPWAGHLGVKMVHKVIPVIEQAKTTLIFTNTRAQTEIWYRQILETKPEWAGLIAMHHGSLSNEIRTWVEDALHLGILKAVVCTSSLDLGVDFRPVDQIIQIGGPKGVARFMQRAGRSGHAPGQTSTIYFLPTHALELAEASALQKAIRNNALEARVPLVRCFDVLIQYLCTLAVGEGFFANDIFNEVKSTFCYESLNEEEWQWVLNFITKGSSSLNAYDEFNKVVVVNGKYVIQHKGIAMRHRLSIGTITSDAVMQVKYLGGGYIGSVEEWFISRLNTGDVFWFAGKNLELVKVKNLTAYVRKTTINKGIIPSWQGGRMPLSSMMANLLRLELDAFNSSPDLAGIEMNHLKEMFEWQNKLSLVPLKNQLLIETYQSKEGFHIFIYPFEGRLVHEGLAGLIAYRISKILPITFTMAFNDYGFELLSDSYVDIEEMLSYNILGVEDLQQHLLLSINAAELAQRRFRDIAQIAGLVFTGYPGKTIKTKHLQAGSALFFKVFKEYEPDNLLLQQAFDEVLYNQFEENRLREALNRIAQSQIVIKSLKNPGPFAFPLMVDRLREKLSSEKLEDRIKKMQLHFLKV
jgi:ATP-dependent Lhr-like helicase